MKRFLAAVAVATVLATGLSLLAARWITGRAAVSPDLKQLLNLLDDQARQLAIAEKEYRAAMDESCKNHCAARYELGVELGKSQMDAAKMAACVERMCAAQAGVEHATLTQILAVRQMLTPAQREQYAKLISAQVCAACPMGMHQP